MLCCGSVKRVFVSVLKFIFFTERLTEKDITVKFSFPQFFLQEFNGLFLNLEFLISNFSPTKLYLILITIKEGFINHFVLIYLVKVLKTNIL